MALIYLIGRVCGAYTDEVLSSISIAHADLRGSVLPMDENTI